GHCGTLGICDDSGKRQCANYAHWPHTRTVRAELVEAPSFFSRNLKERTALRQAQGERIWLREFLIQQVLNLFPELLRLRRRRMSRHGLAVAIDEEFSEIPLDPAAEKPRFFLFQMLENRIGIVAVDVDLRHQR